MQPSRADTKPAAWICSAGSSPPTRRSTGQPSDTHRALSRPATSPGAGRSYVARQGNTIWHSHIKAQLGDTVEFTVDGDALYMRRGDDKQVKLKILKSRLALSPSDTARAHSPSVEASHSQTADGLAPIFCLPWKPGPLELQKRRLPLLLLFFRRSAWTDCST